MNDYQEDLFASKAARDEALEKVSKNANGWMPLALEAIKRLPGGYRGTGQDIKLKLMREGLEEPHNHNAWGAVIRQARKRNLIHHTGEYRHTTTPKSHARYIPVYVRR